MNRTPLALVVTVIAGSALGAPLQFKAGTVDPSTITDVRTAMQAGERLPTRVLVQLDGPMDADRRAAIEASGARVLDYMPTNAFVLDIRRARMEALNVLPFVERVLAFDAAWKVSPDLGFRQYETAEMRALTSAGEVPAVVTLFPGADSAAAANAARDAGLHVVSTQLEGDRFMLEVLGAPAAVRSLSAHDGVQWIEPAPEITLRNSTNRWIVQSNVNGSYPVYNAGIRGEGQLIGVMDGRVAVNHCSFSDPEGDPIGPNHRKIQAYNTSVGYDFHGTHVAGTALGDSGADNDARGVAYNARLVFNVTPSFSYSAVFNRLSTHYSQGATIHTNSWGNDGTVSYDNMCRAIDDFSWQNDDNLVIFAVTNTSTLKNPENAKNVLAVGASQDNPNQGSFCSGGQGTTSDGRRKPEIFAPGCSTRSSTGSSGCSTTTATGTSMAAPAIAGAAALVRQYYTDGFYPTGSAQAEDAFTPSGTLIKATLLNSTVDMTGIAGYPSNREGWGRVLLDNSLYFEGDSRYNIIRDVRNGSNEALSTGDAIEIPFTVNSNMEELRITMVFHDAPAATNASFAPVNNLDLELDSPFGFQLLGNVFSGGFSNTGGTADAINNVEMIRMANPLPGDYVVRVRGAAVNTGQQGYAVVIAGDVTENNFPGCSAADLAEPYGTLNIFDIQAYIGLYNAQDDSADLAAPFGVFNIFDLQEYINQYNIGCP